jgi:hypothetical protein
MTDGKNNTGNSYSQQDVNRSEQMTFQARSLTEELKDQLGIRSRLNETDKETLNLVRQVQRSAQENNVELGNTGKIERQIAKDIKTSLALSRELKSARIGIGKEGQIELDRLAKAKELSEDDYINAFQSLSADLQRVAILEESIGLTGDLIVQRRAEADIQKDINDKMGVSGALVKGTGALMERLGMRSGIFNDAMKESAEAMQEMAEESTRLVDIIDEQGNVTQGTLKNYSKMQIMLKGFSKLSKGFGKALLDPLTLSMGIINNFKKINQTQAQTSRLIGQSAATFKNTLNFEAASLNDVMVQINESTKQLGMSAQAIFSPSTLASMAEAVNMLGITSDQATNLGLRAEYVGSTVDGFTDGILRGADAANKLAGSAVAPGVVLQDVLSTTEDISLSLGENPEALGKAATAARALGLDLRKVDEIAGGLMDFESSIGYELEAQLLTGKQINLSKARELALNNDLAGLAEELANNGATAAEFTAMNRIEQESLAKALGMNRQELAKSILLQDKSGKLTNAQRAEVLGMTTDDLARMDIQTKMNKSLEKMFQLVAPILDTVTMMLEKWYVMYPLITGIGIVGLVSVTKSMIAFVGTIASGITKLLLWTGAKTADAAATSASTIANGANTASLVAKEAALATVAGTQALAASTAAPAAGGIRAMGSALGAFGKAAIPAIPVLLSIAAVFASVGIAAAGIGFGIKMAADGFVSIMQNLSLEKLQPLLLLGPALFSIAAGLGAIAVAGLMAIPAIAGLATLALVASPLIAIGGMFGDSNEKSTDDKGFAKLEAKLDKLISVVTAGGDVFLDGNKVGSALVLGSYKSS